MIYFVYNGSFHLLHVLKVTYFTKSELVNGTYSSNPIKDIDKFKKYTALTLNGNDNHDNIELKKLSDLTNDILAEKGFTDGICINFTNKTKYKNFVTVMDIGNTYADKANFICVDNKVYVWKVKPNEFRKPLPLPPPMRVITL